MLKEFFDNNKFLIFAGLSTLSLVFTSISIISISQSVKKISTDMEPISSWAAMQNQCIERTTAYEGVSSKVWSCNGGGQ
ncbi:hypothetical protein [Prochlorococcus sp. MIT 0916]|uniref:hypothetical protein n=1 Tax=Prochlorococcus sp. MIT 0916 TaxID=3082521 RepID=UPI0039B404C5